VFPQTLFHFILSEIKAGEWISHGRRGETALFHLGQLSSLITGIETPGWTDPQDFKYQMIALSFWGASNARAEEAPLLTEVDAVTVGTVHSAKGLQYAAVFLADVCARRFPSSLASRRVEVLVDEPATDVIDPDQLKDNENHDDERRLMYVALTRAQRYLFVSKSGRQSSRFYRAVDGFIGDVGGTDSRGNLDLNRHVDLKPTEYKADIRLVTSFSDLRYFMECPHDFYLRKVLGFSPSIDQAFGYGRGVHNLMREIHSNPREWAELVREPGRLQQALSDLMERGLFYLRYTTGAPLDRMRNRAVQIISDYVQTYHQELQNLMFEPEREFETLLEEEQLLIGGAIDVIRHDDPPRVTLIDFKSGEADSDGSATLDRDEMALQICLYGLAARRELEYDPQLGLVRYLAESDPEARELQVELNDDALENARKLVTQAAGRIRQRIFHEGPKRPPRNPDNKIRCKECDFGGFCGQQHNERGE
jgi:DNA helicase-2/ATP-dependent DNA helicase PcrA